VFDTSATVTSPVFGPGKAWNKVKLYGSSEDNNDATSFDIITIDKNGKDSVWSTITTSQHEFDISNINATHYPYVQLRMHTKNGVTVKPYQLQDWSVEYTPAPEGTLAPNLGISIPDTLNFDHYEHVTVDNLNGDVVFKNISSSSFDSLKVKLVMYDEYNAAYPFSIQKTRPLAAGDTLQISFAINITDLPEGMYNLYLEINPDNDQPEQYHYNNFLYQYVYIHRDILLPVRLLDFTAKPLNNNVMLQWQVTNQLNVSHYAIEFGYDGHTFNTIGDVAATSMHTTENTYTFLHTAPVNGNNYYRIKMIDVDGKYIYSPTRMVILNKNNIFVYPNPFHDQLNIINSNNTTATVKLLDLTGKLLFQQANNLPTILHVAHVASGIYILQINDGVTIHSFKVYKE
jgi:hypothetical protein